MPTANKTVAWAFPTRITTLATNTTLGTATRHDFAAITIDMPELTRTIRSVKLRVTTRDAFTVATDFDGWRLGIKLGAVAFDDADFTSAAANTGDHETLIVERDVTAYFVANFGAGASQTCQVGVAFQTGVAAAVNCITAELWVTYDYDTAAATHVKTVEIPIQGHPTTISTTDVEIGTTGGVSDAPANQIPSLTTFLPEAGKTFKQIYLRITAIDAGGAATNFNLSVKLDAGGTYDARATIEQTLITAAPYRDLVDLTAAPYSITTNAAHALIVKSSLATTFENISAVLVVTYTFTPSGTTREIHSLRVPLENERGVFDPSHGVTAGDDDRYSALLDIEEPGTITMLQSGVVIFDQMLGANATTTAIYNSAQGVRVYAHANLIRSGPHIYTRRCDHDSSNWALARGQNRLTIDSRISAAGNSEISGYAIVNYTSDVAVSGVGTGNRSCAFALASNPAPATAGTIISAEERLPNFPSSPWKLTGGAWGELGIRALISTVSTVIQAERAASEDSGNGWYAEAITCGNSGELGRRETIRPITRWVRASSFRQRGMSLLTTRRWRVAVAATVANLEWCGTVWTTHHDQSFTVAGVVTSGGAPVANGNAVKVYADDGVEAEFITSTTTGGGNGAFSVEVTDNTRSHFATYDVSGVKGWSGLATPESGTFDITIAGSSDVIITSTPSVSTTSTSATIAFTASSAAEYSLDGGAYTSTTSPLVLSGLSLGSHTVTIRLVASPAVLQSFTWSVTAAGTSFPVLAIATTAESIRDRALAVISALIPRRPLGTRFVKHQNERDGDFVKWALANPAAALRRFQVRSTDDDPPMVSNTDYEERRVKLTITIAYPTTARSGADQALDRDDLIDQDYKQLDYAIGMYGRANFSPPYPDAMPLGFSPQDIVRGEAVDLLVIEEWFTYQRLTS